MDSGMKDNSPEGIRERVESKRDEFAGSPDSVFETLEAAVDDTRHEAAQARSGDGGAQSSGSVSPSGGVATESATTAQTTAGGGSVPTLVVITETRTASEASRRTSIPRPTQF